MPAVQVVGETIDSMTLVITDSHHSPASTISAFLNTVNTNDLIGDALSAFPQVTPAEAIVALLREQASEWEALVDG